MLYLFKLRKLGAFLAHGQQYRRMVLVYLVMPSQGFKNFTIKVIKAVAKVYLGKKNFGGALSTFLQPYLN